MSNVEALRGGLTGELQVYEHCVSVLEETLIRARSGDVCGVVVIMLHHDRLASYQMGGMIQGYAILGAAEIAKSGLAEIVKG